MRKQLIIGLAVLAFTNCGPGRTANKDGTIPSNESGGIKIDGSATVFLISEAVAEDYREDHSSVNITVGTSGSGGGFKKFGRGETDISDASRPINTDEDSVCKAAGIDYIELPVAYDGLTVVVNKANNWLDKITVKELKMMWEPGAQDKIKTWNQINSAWPKEEIHLFGPGTASGTFDYFTQAINGKEKASRGDYTASADDNVLVQGIGGDKYALGYFGLAYYENNKDKLKVVPVDDEKAENGEGPVTPSQETVKNGTYQPLSRPLFIYINKKSLIQPEVKLFVDYYLANAAKLAAEVGYIPLPDEVYDLVKARFAAGTTGSIFLGKAEVGVRMEDMLKAEQVAK